MNKNSYWEIWNSSPFSNTKFESNLWSLVFSSFRTYSFQVYWVLKQYTLMDTLLTTWWSCSGSSCNNYYIYHFHWEPIGHPIRLSGPYKDEWHKASYLKEFASYFTKISLISRICSYSMGHWYVCEALILPRKSEWSSSFFSFCRCQFRTPKL